MSQVLEKKNFYRVHIEMIEAMELVEDKIVIDGKKEIKYVPGDMALIDKRTQQIKFMKRKDFDKYYTPVVEEIFND